MRRRTLLLGGLAALGWSSLSRQSADAAAALDGPRLVPERGAAKWLVVLCHGSGGDGPNMFGLANPLQRYLPSAAFASPTGPFPREDIGYRWFPGALGRDPIGMVMRGMREGGPVFDAFLDAELARLKLAPDRLNLLGFSQGSMMVLNWGLRRKALPAGIIGFAGLQIATEGLPQLKGAPPVLLVQGALDGDPARLQNAADILKAHGAPVQSHLLSGLGHAIDDRGIRLAGTFLQDIAAKAG
jgi:phospholipase/carboxylesterase